MKISSENFSQVIEGLEKQLQLPFPGENAHMKMASRLRLKEMKFDYKTENAIKSAVLILFYPDTSDGKIKIALILRPDYDGVHSGQVAFPGGRMENEDTTLIHTALREAREEVNIQPEKVTIMGTLSDLYIPPSNYIVTPVLGYSHLRPEFLPDKEEVAAIIEADINLLFDESIRKEKVINVRGYEIEAPYYDINGYVVWGATAMILSELTDVIESLN